MNVNSHVYMRLSEVYNIFCNVFEKKNVLIETNNFVFCCVLIDHLVNHPKEEKVWLFFCIAKIKVISEQRNELNSLCLISNIGEQLHL